MYTIHELDECNEATGTVHLYCSLDCREKALSDLRSNGLDVSRGSMEEFDPSCVCEWCYADVIQDRKKTVCSCTTFGRNRQGCGPMEHMQGCEKRDRQ